MAMSRRWNRALTGWALAGLALSALVGALIVSGLGIGLGAEPAVAAEPDPEQVPRPVVVVGLAGLTWDAVNATDTPTIAGLLAGGAGGALAVHSLHGAACPVDGWLALSSGRLAAAPPAPDEPHECPPMTQPEHGSAPPDWPD
jgi:hypothetical protein